MRLEAITPDNYAVALAVQVRPDQQDLVAPVVKSLAEAYVYPDVEWPRLIYDGDRPVGFLKAILNIAWDSDRDPGDRRSGLWRLNIAADAQGRGYGTFAVEAVSREIRDRGGDRIYVSYEPRPGGPADFYRKLGFRPTGEHVGGQVVAVRDL
jgi:diamine N-acetyltransferase